MQKRLLFVAFLLLAICNKIVADDQLTVSDVSMYPGDSKEVSIELTNAESYVGFQFDLYLPNGITIESYSRSSRIPDGTTLEMAQQTDGGYRFIAAGLGGNAITGNEGAVMTITLKSADAIALNDYTAYLRQVKVSKADGSGITVAEQPFTVTIAERPKVASVTFAPNGYRVTLNTTTEGADIYYTLSNSNEGEQTCTSGTELTLGGDCTIMAYAMKDGYNTSDTTTYTFFAADVTVATPTFNQTDNMVTISTTTENTTIYYTLDGTEPTTLSNVYAEPGITLTGNVIVKAFATRTNWFSSAVATYDVTSFKVAPVAFAQNGNQITLSTTTEGATIYYILSTDSVYSEYTAPLTMTGDCTITAYATKVGYTQSETTSFEFHAGGVTCSNPVLTRIEGTNVVTATTATEGATIYYTTDGSEPTHSNGAWADTATLFSATPVADWSVPASTTDAEITSSYATITGGKMYVTNFRESDVNVVYIRKEELAFVHSSNKDMFFKVVLNNALQAGDVISTRILSQSGSYSDDDRGLWFSTATSRPDTEPTSKIVLAHASSTEWVTAPTYTVAEDDGICGETTFYIYRHNTHNTCFNTFTITRKTAVFPTEGLTVSRNQTIKAIAMRDTYYPSQVTTFEVDWFKCGTPTFSWNGDELTISCATEGANIYYTIFEGQESDDTYVPEEKLYTGPITVNFNTVITAVARMQGMNDSETATLNYPYFSWNHLLQSIEYAKAVMHRVVDEGKYEQVAELYDALDVELAKAQVLYNNRNRSEDAASIDSLANQLGAAARTIEDILDTPTEKLDTPVISWNGDEMYWLVYQQGSGVMTWLSDFDSNNDGVVDDKDFFNIHTTLTIKRDVTIRAYSYMEGKLNSDTITIDYPYTAWMSLLEALNYSNYVVSLCQGSSKVSQDDVMALRTKIEDASYLYSLRQEKRAVIENIAQELRMRAAQLEAQVTDVDFTYDTTTGSLTVSGGTTMDEALEAAGGRNTVAGHVTSIIWDKDTPLTDDMLEGFTNPNMLVYVKDASLAPSTVTNVIVDGVADFILLVDTDSLDNDFYCPKEFRTRTISYTRLFGQSTEIGVCRGWETIALPFEPLTISHEKNGLLRPFASAANDGKPFWLRQMSATGLVDAERIEANVPYIISMPNNPNYADEFNQAGRVTFSATDVVIPATDLGEVEGATVSLIPTFQRVAKAPEVYAINRYEAYGNNLEGSVFVSELRDVRPFEAYTRHHDQSPAPMFYPLSEWLEDGANGIDEIVLAMSRMAGQSETWYTLDGRKLNGQPKTKGVYIVKGKKVVVR